jgi:phospholipid transport system substrate-binding protein
MYLNYVYRGVVLFLLVFCLTVPVWAGEPTDQIKVTVDKIIAILSDPELEGPEKADERRKLIRRAADERFDWQVIAQRTLARHWRKRTDEEKQEFVPLFTDLLERTYMNRLQNYSGEKVVYDGEEIADKGKYKGKRSRVNVTVFTSKGVEIHAEYRLLKKGNDWFIYDVLIEGVSLVKNYRDEFNDIIMKSSYKELVEKLKEKVARNDSTTVEASVK